MQLRIGLVSPPAIVRLADVVLRHQACLMLDLAINAVGGPGGISLLVLVPLPEEDHRADDCEDESGYADADAGFGAYGEARGGFGLRGVCGEEVAGRGGGGGCGGE
jgi:hypothetical protein